MKGFHASALVPTGLTVKSIAHGDTETIITVRSAQRSARCPGCDPALLTAAEKLQYDAYLRREDTNTAILGLAKSGHAIKEIGRRTGYSSNDTLVTQGGPDPAVAVALECVTDGTNPGEQRVCADRCARRVVEGGA